MEIKIDVPVGKKGIWEIDEFEISERQAQEFNMRALFQFSSSNSDRRVEAGTYKRLVRDGKDTIMSNTPAEINDCAHFIRMAHGKVLINGLGLGVVLTAILKKKEIKSVVVIEKEKDVIDLVAPTFKDKRLTIINEDAYEYKPPKGERYDFVWHDIWDDLCSDNLELMGKLHRKYGRRTSWQDSWGKLICLHQRTR
ncbi:MAG: hypothetical protein HOG49_06325 [Candidatus Scalindua sp.]|jgi:hypothetical protein|nr:hypothetical protein [Candidatus Scalindua sp.]